MCLRFLFFDVFWRAKRRTELKLWQSTDLELPDILFCACSGPAGLKNRKNRKTLRNFRKKSRSRFPVFSGHRWYNGRKSMGEIGLAEPGANESPAWESMFMGINMFFTIVPVSAKKKTQLSRRFRENSAKCSRSFEKFSEVFGSFWKFSEVFGRVQMRPDVFWTLLGRKNAGKPKWNFWKKHPFLRGL